MRAIFAMLLSFVFAVPTVSAQNQAQKRTVAVMDFEFGAVQKWWDGDWNVGKGISDLLVDELLKDGTYRLVERKRLDMVAAEQNLAAAQKTDNQAALLGKLMGANAMVTGSVTQFGMETKKKGFGIGAISRVAGLGGFDFHKDKGKAKVAVTARIVSATSGEILGSVTGQGESAREGLMLGGLGAGSGGGGVGAISMGSSNFRETVLGEATVAAVADLVKGLVVASTKIPVVVAEIRGKIAFVDGPKVVLNIGSASGVAVGDTLAVVNVKNTIKDPDTGKVIKEDTEELGTIRVEQVDSASSTAVVVSGSGFQIGNLVTKK